MTYLISLLIIVAAVGLGLLLQGLLFRLLRKLAVQLNSRFLSSVTRHCRSAARFIVPLFCAYLAVPIAFAPEQQAGLRHFFSVALIVALAWIIIKIIYVIQDLILANLCLEASDNLHARRIHTQIRILRRLVIVAVVVVAIAAVLMTFEGLRQFGTGVLASAGVAGLVIGFAAQRTLANLLAGIQIAITQPITIDDVVIVEGEWGWIEEITLTYVVVRIWDLRRLIVPISYFIEQPFQNWTRTSADILGTVFLYVDYTVPVAAVRAELARILEASPLWDGKVCAVQVTNTSERSMELRALLSAGNSSAAWDLRCLVREQLIDFIKREYPTALPYLRAELKSPMAVSPTAVSPKAVSPKAGS